MCCLVLTAMAGLDVVLAENFKVGPRDPCHHEKGQEGKKWVEGSDYAL